jgi:hypothetical protein
VKPALRMFLVCFIWFLSLGAAEQRNRRVNYDYDFVPLIACCNHAG